MNCGWDYCYIPMAGMRLLLMPDFGKGQRNRFRQNKTSYTAIQREKRSILNLIYTSGFV